MHMFRSQSIEKWTSLLFISGILLIGSLDCSLRAWTICSRPLDEFPIADLVTEMDNLVGRTCTIALGWELLVRRKQCAIFCNSVIKLDDGLKRKTPKC